MPGNVSNSAPSEVLPASLSAAFSYSSAWAVSENIYQNGEHQARAHTTTSRKRFVLTKRLTRTELEELRDFYDARSGPIEPFYFYFLWETDPLFTNDETGVATAGRYTVRFDGDWSQAAGMSRGEVSISLIELA